jgi:hypothetical protein
MHRADIVIRNDFADQESPAFAGLEKLECHTAAWFVRDFVKLPRYCPRCRALDVVTVLFDDGFRREIAANLTEEPSYE